MLFNQIVESSWRKFANISAITRRWKSKPMSLIWIYRRNCVWNYWWPPIIWMHSWEYYDELRISKGSFPYSCTARGVGQVFFVYMDLRSDFDFSKGGHNLGFFFVLFLRILCLMINGSCHLYRTFFVIRSLRGATKWDKTRLSQDSQILIAAFISVWSFLLFCFPKSTGASSSNPIHPMDERPKDGGRRIWEFPFYSASVRLKWASRPYSWGNMLHSPRWARR